MKYGKRSFEPTRGQCLFEWICFTVGVALVFFVGFAVGLFFDHLF